MSETIGLELMFFFVSIKSGAFLLLAYDFLRIFRRILKHKRFFVAMEDLLFWIIASIYLFGIMYEQNDGVIRGFSILGMGLGMIIYYNLLSNIVINISTIILRKIIMLINSIIRGIIYPFRVIIQFLHHIFRKPSRAFLRLLKKIYRKALKGLKKIKRTVKISITKE